MGVDHLLVEVEQGRRVGRIVRGAVALRSGRAQKVAIVDWDVHHGNGTQHLFYDDGRVLYISLHRYGPGWYPESGALEETGAEGNPLAAGTTCNIPFPENGLGDTDYMAAFRLVVCPILAHFRPDLQTKGVLSVSLPVRHTPTYDT